MNVYEIVTGKLIAALERGTAPWRRPWRGADGAPRNIVSRREYRGINALLLGMAGYSSPTWGTIKQINAAGGRVKRGERSTLVVFFKKLDVERENADGETVTRKAAMLRYYLVFNVDQCEGLKLEPTTAASAAPEPVAAGEAVIAAMPNPPMVREGPRACYSPAFDRVELPARAQFHSATGYYATLFHELAHATGHTSRLNRPGITGAAAFGSGTYSREELVAEMGAAFVMAAAGLEDDTEQHAAYLKSWIAALRGDARLAVTAAGQAQKAADYILNRPNITGQSAGQGA